MLFQVGGNFRLAFDYLRSWGLDEAILPFLLFFAVIFAVLMKIKIFKDPEDENKADRKMNAIISFVIAMMVIVPHIMNAYPAGADPIDMVNALLPNAAAIIFAIVLILIIVGMMGQQTPGIAPITRLAGLGGVAIIVWIFVANMFPALGISLGFLRDPRTQALVVVLAVFAVIVWFITKEDKPKPKESYKRLHELFGGK